MERDRFFGGHPLAVILRLVVLSIIVGVALSALGITPQNFVWRIRILLQRLYDMGLGAVDWALGYLLLGAIVVVPVWLLMRLFARGGDRRPD